MLTLEGKTAILTGATGTIGQEIARLFLALGCQLVLGDIDEEGLSRLEGELGQKGEVCVHRHEAVSESAAAELVGRAVSQYGKLDYLVTAAGLMRRTQIADISSEEFHLVNAVNYEYVFNLCRASIPRMTDGGAIVNLASLSAHTGRAGSSHYAAAKGAVLALTKSIAEECAPRLRANCISPGFVDSPISRPVLADVGSSIVDRIPARRFGLTREIAHAVAFLCSDWSTYITGQTLHVNGGLYAPG